MTLRGCPPTFLRRKKKRREAKKTKERASRQELSKVCHEGQNVTVLLLVINRIQIFIITGIAPKICFKTIYYVFSKENNCL